MVRDGLIIFNSVHKVMSAEKYLKSCGVNAKVMPVPRQLSSDCGLALVFPLDELEVTRTVLAEPEYAEHSLYALEAGGEYRLMR